MRPNAKHEKMAQALADGHPQHVAFKIAGFKAAESHSAASKLMTRNGSIAVRRDEILAERERIAANGLAEAIKTTGMDKAWVLAKLGEIVAMGMAARPVLDSKGEPTGDYTPQLGPANRALELIGKEQGMFIDRKEVRTGNIEELTPEALQRKWADTQREAGVNFGDLPKLPGFC